MLAVTTAAHHTSTGPYLLGAAVIAVVSIGLLVHLIVMQRRARRRR
jgi:hypothetical protein